MARFGTYSENTSPADADLLVSVDVSDTTDDATGSTKRLSLSGLRTFFGAIFAPLASPTFTGTTTTAALTATTGAFSGAVTVTNNYAAVNLTAAVQSYVNFRDSTGNIRINVSHNDGTGQFKVDQRDASGVYERTPFLITSTGATSFTGAPSVTVPVPTTTGDALRWGSDATVAALTATDGILSSGSTGTSVPAAEGLEVINTNATSGEQRVKLSVTSSGGPRLDIMSDDGSSQLRNAFIARPDGEFRLTGNTSVSVPVPTTTGHALRWSSAANVASLELNAGGLTGLGDVVEEVSTANVTGAYTLVDGFGIYDLTMTADSTLTFPTAPASGDGTSFLLILRGAFTPTLPATVDWAGGTPPAYVAALSMYAFTTVDGGAMWLGVQAGAGFA
jgi:hypothetical protein